MKYIKLIVLFGLGFFLFQSDCFASVNTYTRTKNNLLVPEDVKVTTNNIKDIMNTPSVSSMEKIYDYADLYTSDEEDELYNSVYNYIKDSKVDLAIVTTKDLKGYSLSNYAYNFYDYNDFDEDGIILVIYVSEKKPKIFMGTSGKRDSKVFKLYGDDRIAEILKYVYSDIDTSNYFIATNKYIDSLRGFYGLDRGGNYRIDNEGNIIKVIPWLEIVIISCAFTFIIIMINIYSLNGKTKLSTVGFDDNIDNSTLMVKFSDEELVGTKIDDEK